MNQGETEKASKIFQTALDENGVFDLKDDDTALNTNNHDLAIIIYNFVKCNIALNMHNSMV
jgi:hypothetical protein